MKARDEVRLILEKWLEFKFSEFDIWKWANQKCLPGEESYENWLEGDIVAHQVLLDLNHLDMHFIIRDDIPYYLSFLKSSIAEFDNNFEILQNSLKKRDTTERIMKYKNHPIYGPFC